MMRAHQEKVLFKGKWYRWEEKGKLEKQVEMVEGNKRKEKESEEAEQIGSNKRKENKSKGAVGESQVLT